ncbi:MAG: Wadjet anti-phage system protein JetD domain-containing protein [Bacillota bacterium]
MSRSPLAADYYDEMDYRKREAINSALADLALEAVVDVGWVKFREGQQADKVFLNLETLEKAYRLAGRAPLTDKMSALRDILAPLSGHPWGWVRKWWTEVEGALSRRRIAGLDLEDPEGYRDLVKILLALPEAPEGAPKRVLSQNVLHDSKRFEQAVEKRLLGILKKYGEDEFDTDEEYLDSIGIVDYPKMILICGTVHFTLDEKVVNTGVFPGGVGLSADTVEKMKIKETGVRKVLTVENLTSYSNLVQSSRAAPFTGGPEGSQFDLVIYTGGFPHRTLQKFLRKLANSFSNRQSLSIPEAYHWGDLDYGGIRIFEYIKRNFFGGLKAFLMDVQTYERHLNTGVSFGKDYADKLKKLLSDPSYEPWHPLLEIMLFYGKRVEQDSILP